MPEGPEVRCMADELSSQSGDQLIAIDVLRESPRRDVSQLAIPQVVRAVSSHGKKLLITLTDQTIIFAPLMTGRIMYHPAIKGTTVIMTLTFKSGVKWYLEDARTFSQLTVVPNSDLQMYLSEHVGPDWLSDQPVSFEKFKSVCNRRKASIGILLVDQKLWSGIGNYLRAEILYRCKISPFRSAKSLTDTELKLLHSTIHEIIREAYRGRGLTISQYITPTGKRGEFVPMIYGRKTDPDGRQVSVAKLGSQSIHWVPEVQK